MGLETTPAGGKIKGETQIHRTITLKSESPWDQRAEKVSVPKLKSLLCPGLPTSYAWSLHSPFGHCSQALRSNSCRHILGPFYP